LGDKSTLHDDAVLVIGLGRFGSAIADALNKLGHEVLAIERNPKIVQEWSGRLTHVVEADGTNMDALTQIGVKDFPIAVVGIGTSVEASVLATANLVDLGNKQVWAKAITPAHGRILERIGAHRVIYPEADAGEKVAHLVSGKLLDYIEFEDGYAIVKMRPPLETHGFTLGQSQVRKKYGVTVVGVKSPGEDFTYAQPDTLVSSHDTLIVAGNSQLLERFAARP
jgi:trk system potassium uptake protein TrkA